ncbi:MAG: hypothetical protein GWO40_17630 [Gammaproteobacteria bacterium]|nr:hypothetical protein [Gammaproteobacteria bacterium]NIU06074.1 hypothetical protein [Gammaproteobacteria bacterium]NIX87347.1 hypothetical protein [Gammaproteobacteria bacterium]
MSILSGVMLSAMVFSAQAGNQGGKRTYQTADLQDFATDAFRAGAATLVRTRNEVWVNISSADLDPDSAYTVWWVVFNNPDECFGDCGLDDLGSPAVDAGVFYAAGFVTDLDGTANASFHLKAGPPPEGADFLLDARGDGDGLDRGNGFGADIHLIVRTHEGLIPGRVAEQIGSFAGACDVNACEDQQFAIFPAVD